MKPKYLGKHNSLSRNSSLDRIARKESRKDFNEFESFGLDIWNAYEFSYLLNGKPKIVVLEISIPSNSKYTIESKSMKLFLNSFFDKNYENQAEDGIRDLRMSRGLGDVYKRQPSGYMEKYFFS